MHILDEQELRQLRIFDLTNLDTVCNRSNYSALLYISHLTQLGYQDKIIYVYQWKNSSKIFFYTANYY